MIYFSVPKIRISEQRNAKKKQDDSSEDIKISNEYTDIIDFSILSLANKCP